MKKYLLFLLTVCVFMSGCSNKDVTGEKGSNELELKPVTIKMQQYLGEKAHSELQKLVTDKYPHITVEQTNIGGHERNHYEEAVAAKQIPDILAIVSSVHNENLFNVDLDYDLTGLIDQFDYDLSRFDEMTLEGIRNDSREGIMGLPFVRGSGLPNYGALMYNKDVFDIFGVPYPEEGMSWDDTIKLARELTAMHEGIQYYGLLTNNFDQLISFATLGAPILDPETHESLLDSPLWQRGIDLLKTIYSIPGYMDSATDEEKGPMQLQNMFAQRQAAMAFGFIPSSAISWDEEGGLHNWDIVPAPNFPDGGLAPISGSWIFTISSASDHKEDAFRVMEVLMSDEFMIKEGGRQGEPSRLPLIDRKVLDQVVLHPVMEGKNLDALYYHASGPPVERSKYESYILREYFRGSLDEFLSVDQDRNTFIREANEEIETLITDRISEE